MSRGKDRGGTRPHRDDPRYFKVLPYAWLLFSAVWLFYSAGFVTRVLQTSPTTTAQALFLGSLAVFAVPFVSLMVRYSCPDAGLPLRKLRARFALLAVLFVIALCVEVVYGFGIPWRFMYPVVAAAVVLPTRYAVWAALSVSAFAVAFYGERSGWGAVAANWTNLITFLTSGAGMVVVSRLVVMLRELQEARQEIARLAVSEERLRFARDLHDLLGHSLSSITLKSELADRLLEDDGNRAKAAKEVRDIQAIARGALREVREAVSGYRRPSLEYEFAGAREMLEAADIACRTRNEAGAVPAEVEAILTWVVREGVTNVVRHSRAGRCEIRLWRDGDRVHAEVDDNGRGPGSGRSDDGVGGSGLSGLAERVERSGGRLETGPPPQGGFRLRVGLPAGGDGAHSEGEERTGSPSGAQTTEKVGGR